MAWMLELVAGLALASLALARDLLAGAPDRDLGLKQSLVVLGGLLLAADGAWRARPSRRGLFESLDERSVAGRLALWLIGGLLVALGVYTFRNYAVDDSWITYRYSRNLLETGRVVWNQGGPAVEGYSNFLWMLLATGALSLRLDPLMVSRVVSIACLVISALLVHRLAVRQCATALAPRLAALALLATPSFAFWGMSGLETVSVVTLVLGWLLAYEADFSRSRLPWRTAIVGALLVLSRPEGPLFIGLTLLPSLISGQPAERRNAVWLALLVAALSSPYFAWKQAHFGTILPNTMSAKLEPLTGLPLAVRSLAFAFPALALTLVRFARGGSRLEGQVWLLWAGLTLVSVQVRPHVAHYLRFYLPALGAIAALVGAYAEQIGEWLRGAPERRARLAGTGLAVAAFAYLLIPIFEMQIYSNLEARGLETAHVPVGKALAETYRGRGLLAASDCGIVPYIADMRTIDIWGLTDRTIATRGFDPTYVMSERPDVVILHSLNPDVFSGREFYDREMEPAVRAEPSLRLRGCWPFYGYWLWVYSREPLNASPPGS